MARALFAWPGSKHLKNASKKYKAHSGSVLGVPLARDSLIQQILLRAHDMCQATCKVLQKEQREHGRSDDKGFVHVGRGQTKEA